MKQTIYTMRMAQHLINLGFKVADVVPNAKDMSKNIWIFDDEQPGFKEAFAAYIAKGKPHAEPKPERKPVQVSDETLAGLYYVGNQSVENIARVHGVTVERVLNALRNDKRVLTGLAYALMMDKERAAVNQLSQVEREAALLAKLKDTPFYILHNGKENLIVSGEVQE